MLLNALNDITVIVLIVSGVLSLVLDFSFNGGKSWVEGAAILAAVTVVVLVTAINDFQKEKQFWELSELSEESEVSTSGCLVTLLILAVWSSSSQRGDLLNSSCPVGDPLQCVQQCSVGIVHYGA